ncbi:MAG: diacylglycerol kinase family lipid kinase [Bacteroidales bacterium]|nr:diacylglycerol kinase family lipid kinase [Bacteroidales bacterium]
MNKRKIFFIINPHSGVNHGKKGTLPSLIQEVFPEKDFEIKIKSSRSAEDVFNLSSYAVEHSYETLVVVGGDGTVNEAAEALCGTKTKLGIIPLGSGNGLAHHLNIPFGLKESLESIKTGNNVWIDTLRINNKLAVSIAGIGFDAKVARQFALADKRGFFSYLKISLREYFTYKPRVYTLQIDGKTIQTRAFFISIANSDQFGYNTSIAPAADIKDGLAEICIVKRIPLFRTPFFAALLFSKNADKSRYVTIFKASECTIERKKGKYVNIDGESVKMKKLLQIKVIPESLNVIIP